MGEHEAKAVYKHSIPVDDQVHEIELADNSNLVLVGHQGDVNRIVLWFEEPQIERTRVRRFKVFPTGHLVPVSSYMHVGSVIMYPLPLVWHVYEVLH